MDVDLEEGDFVYQSDLELFLVVIDETDNSYRFAAHGWREIDKNRVDEYLSHDNAKLHRADDVTDVVENNGSDEEKEHFNQLKTMFDVYDDIDLKEEGPHTEFDLTDP